MKRKMMWTIMLVVLCALLAFCVACGSCGGSQGGDNSGDSGDVVNPFGPDGEYDPDDPDNPYDPFVPVDPYDPSVQDEEEDPEFSDIDYTHIEGSAPILRVSDKEIQLIVEEDTYELGAEVLFEKTVQSDADITFESLKPDIASVDETGLIKANNVGETEIRVVASWGGTNSIFLTEIVSVKVKEDVAILMDTLKETIYLISGSFGGQYFADHVTITFSAYSHEKTVVPTSVEWVSSDPSIATVNNGVVRAVKAGVANITVKCVIEGTEYESAPVVITVSDPVVAQEKTIVLDASIATIGEQISAKEVFGNSNLTITKVLDNETGLDVTDDTSYLNKYDLGSEADRTVSLTVYSSADFASQVTAIVATKVITSYEDLVNIQQYGNVQEVEKGNKTYNDYSGYFALGKNIDVPASAAAINTKSLGGLGSQNEAVATCGFHGTFDGRGYSIINAKFGTGGLLGDVAKDGVVKNVSIVNATICEEDTENCGGGVLAFTFWGKAENVFISYTTDKARTGIVSFANNAMFKDVVVYYQKTGGYMNGAIARWVPSELTIDNVYVIYAAINAEENCVLIGESVLVCSDPITEIREAELSSATFSGLDENIWIIEAGEIPEFRNPAAVEVGNVIDKTDTVIYLDASSISSVSSQIMEAADSMNLFGKFSNAIIVDERTGDEIQDNESWIKDHDAGSESARTLTLIVSDPAHAYRVKVLVVTKIITRYDQLAAIYELTDITTGKNQQNKTYYSYGGYYILGSNITADGTQVFANPKTLGSIGSGGDMATEYGFHGTFDGLGYKISGFSYGLGGVFGDIGKDAVIRNVAFEDCTILAGQGGAGVLCSNAKGQFTVENVYIDVTTYATNSGIFGRSVRFGNVIDTVIVYNEAVAGNTKNGALAGWGVEANGNVAISLSNVYIILKGYANLVFGNTDEINVAADSDYTLVQATANPNTITYSGLDANIWNVQAGSIPTFRYVAPMQVDADIIEKTDAILYLDACSDVDLYDQIMTAAENAALFDAFNNARIYDDRTGDEILNGAKWLLDHDAGNEAARTLTLIVSESGHSYRIKVLVTTKIIRTAAELASLQGYVDVTTGKNAANNTYYSYDGYFILGNNITATGNEAAFSASSVGSIGSGGHMDASYGFHGTFDGMGYTVSGFNFEVGGIFGDIGDNAVIKNVAFADAKATKIAYNDAATRQDGIGVLSANAKGSFTIENVYVEFDTKSANGGALLGRSINGGTIKNTVIIHKQTAGWTTGAIAGWGVWTSGVVLDNVYMILQGGATRVFGNTDDVNVDASSKYTVVKANEDPTAITYSGLDGSIWNVKEGSIPTFITNVQDVIYMSAKRMDGDNVVYGNAGTVNWYLRNAFGLDGVSSIKENGATIPVTFLEDHDKTNNSVGRTATLTFTGSDGKDYSAKVFVVTKIIESYNDLINIQAYGNVTNVPVSGVNDPYHDYSGYFVLGGNIIVPDSAAAINTASIGGFSSQSNLVSSYGFHGIFDGMGYSIINAKFGSGGLLGDVAPDGVVKNLALINATICEEDYTNGGGGVLGFTFWGKANNVFISYTTQKARTGIVKFTNSATFENMVVYYKKTGGYFNGALVNWTSNKITTNNVYVIYSADNTDANCVLYGESNFSTSSPVTEIREENIATATFSGLSNSIWNVQPGSIPTFNTAE